MFLTGLICVLAFFHSWENYVEVVLGVVTFPIVMTLAEAVAPHTWDTPMLMFTGALLVFAITSLPSDIPYETGLAISLGSGIGGGLVNVISVCLLILYIRRHPVKKEMAAKESPKETDALISETRNADDHE